MLTNIEILALRPRDKSYKVADGLGLYVQVQPTGSILWRFKYRFCGIERKLCFGSFPEVSLKEARALRDEARGKVAADIDPSAVRRKAKLEAAMAASDTFRAIADEFIAKMEREGKSEATIRRGLLSWRWRPHSQSCSPQRGRRTGERRRLAIAFRRSGLGMIRGRGR